MSHPLLPVREALLVLSAMPPPAQDPQGLLAATLDRLGVSAERQRVLALLEHPEQGRRYQVRVTPCIVLDTGSRLVQLLGDPSALDGASLEAALLRA